MARSVHQLRNRAPLKIVETQELVVGSPEALPGPDVHDTPSLPESALNVPSTAGEFLEASVAEDGGARGMGTRRGSQHQYRAVLHEAIVRVAGALDTQGVCDKNGRLRRSWLSELQGLIREARSIDEALGLPKKASEPGAAAGGRRRDTIAIPTDPAGILPEEIEAFFDRMDLDLVEDAK